MSAPLLEVRDLSVRLHLPHGVLSALEGVDLTLEAGETLCVVGESGCGKSMLALSLMRLLPRAARLSAERIVFAGTDLSRLTSSRFAAYPGNRIAMIFQDPMTAFNPVMRFDDQLFEGFLRHGKGTRAEARDKALHLLERLGVPLPQQRLRQYPHELSGGLRQRMMIAMALMCDPELLIADEPTTALDVTMQVQTLRLLMELKAELGSGLILVTHDLGVVSRIADEVAVMYAGRIVERASRGALFAQPRHPYTIGLMGCVPVPGRAGRLATIPGAVTAQMGARPGCGFAARCRLAEPVCRESAPPVQEHGGHSWRCIPEDAPARLAQVPA